MASLPVTSRRQNQSANAAWGPWNLIAYEIGKDIMLIDATSGAPRNLTAGITTEPDLGVSVALDE